MDQPPDRVDTFELLRARPSDPSNIRALRFAVIAMGLLLIAGFGAVIARIVYLTSRTAPTSFAQTGGTSVAVGPIASEINLVLPFGAKVTSQSLSTNKLSLHYDANGVQGIMIVDLETGKSISNVHLSTATK